MFCSHQLSRMDMKNIFILSGPTGSGKDSVIRQLEKRLPLERIINTTSRAKRPGESEGHPYYFVSPETFQARIAQGWFVEHSVNENGAHYGVSKAELKRVVAQKDSLALWQMDWKGVQSIKKLFPTLPAIFICAPLEILEQRIRSRDTSQNEAYFLERMSYTKEWLTHTDIYDYIVNNEQGKLDQAVSAIEQILRRTPPLSSL